MKVYITDKNGADEVAECKVEGVVTFDIGADPRNSDCDVAVDVDVDSRLLTVYVDGNPGTYATVELPRR